MGFLPTYSGWSKFGRHAANLEHPALSPRAFRFTLASISNFVALGDVAFQQQAKHARITMSHSYAANSATSEWNEVLNTLANVEAQQRTAQSVDLYMGLWAGDRSLAGHAGRELTRTVGDLLAGLDIDPFDPDSDESTLEQFTTRVMSSPELAQAIRSTATMLYPGNIAHCLRYVPRMECAEDGVEPIQGLCRPETCANVLLTEEQQEVMQLRLGQVQQWLSMPRVPVKQREVFSRRERHLTAQLRGIDDGE